MAFDFKAATPDTSLATSGFLFGADSQSATDPSIYSILTVAGVLLGATALVGETITTDKKLIDQSVTWNASGVTFTAWKLNVTNTASAAGSLLMDLQVGGDTKFKVSKAGNWYIRNEFVSDFTYIYQQTQYELSIIGQAVAGGAFTSGVTSTSIASTAGSARIGNLGPGDGLALASGSAIYFSSVASQNTGSTYGFNFDVVLQREAAGVLAQRNSTNAQTFRIYNTYTDASNYERLKMGWNANVFEIKPEAAGTGTTRVIHLSGLPTSNPGAGILWNNAGTPAIGT